MRARVERETECDARGKEYAPLVTSLFYALPTVRLANGFRELVALTYFNLFPWLIGANILMGVPSPENLLMNDTY